MSTVQLDHRGNAAYYFYLLQNLETDIIHDSTCDFVHSQTAIPAAWWLWLGVNDGDEAVNWPHGSNICSYLQERVHNMGWSLRFIQQHHLKKKPCKPLVRGINFLCVGYILWPHSDLSSSSPPDAVFAWPVFVRVWGHSVVDAEVKKATEIDAVIGHVAPVGVAAGGSTDSGQGNSSQIKDWPKQNGLKGPWRHIRI